uniref:Envelope glycoprotein H n=1 Tax=Mastomys natalensis cytomegalovirus 2 TaxID=2973540 RepID=A0A9Y1IK24_9BETA|nr:envelope glycoprotein H [Mastomys natalensis cytomegalovirus 2]WEG69210.1 envelope glycoprotein H [Mastomys natalensis cytomegalovirus 2]WEG69349.1 envelope glycoprotein H [Mastomys natalensis cytomegalovirus 2]WEG69487.1 envelope glycoprotein H [Mastomys natalensis cytomegalovirus 2]WEG69625.1 envelope glycoprotein H [Mastomys natalensis cytomegalovirus 2]
MKTTLILITTASLLCVTRFVAGQHESPISSFIRYSPYSRTKVCTNNDRSNVTIADAALFTFNFNDGDTVKVFQVPRCIFDTDVARTIFQSVNLTENIDEYRRRFRDFYIVPLHGTYKLIPKSSIIIYLNSGLSPPPSSSVTIKSFLIDMKTAHQIRKDKLCAISDHPAIFSVRVLCSHHIMQWETHTATISLAAKFFILTLGPNPSPSEDTLALFFGEMRQLDLKAPYSAGAFMLRQTDKHDLLIIVREAAANTHYRFLDEPTFLVKTLSSDYTDLNICLRVFSSLAGTILRTEQCGKITRITTELLFTYGLCMFVANNVRYQENDPISLPAWRQSELELAGQFIRRCFRTLTANPTPTFRSRAVLKTKDDLHISNIIASLSTAMHTATMADLTYLFRSETIPPNANQNILFEKLLLSVDSYYRSSLKNPLSTQTRRVLLRVDEAIRTQLNTSEPARIHFLLLASMCSPKELLLWSEALYTPNKGAPSELYSPCLCGARRDYNHNTIKTLLSTARRPAYRGDTAMMVSKLFTPPRKEVAEESYCLPDTVSSTSITSAEVTYVFTSEYAIKGVIYPVTNTVIGKNLIITVLKRQTACILSKKYRDLASVTVVNNVTFTERCEFCGSTLVEYDEVGGLTNIIYIPTFIDLQFITDPQNRLLVATPRIHYLLLTKNGTVLEVTDILIRMKRVSYSIMIISMVATTICLAGLYKLCRRK